MATINLKDFYSWYTRDELVEVPDEIAAELFADKRYHKAYDRRMKRNKSYSLDFEADYDSAVMACHSDNPEYIFTMMERHCQLCQALNSLPDIQGRRIDAHFLLGKSHADIAQAEGVSESAVYPAFEYQESKYHIPFQPLLKKCLNHTNQQHSPRIDFLSSV